MSSARTALRERVAALGRARRAFDAARLEDAERILRDELGRWPGNRDAQALLAEVSRARGLAPGHESPPPAAAPLRAGPDAWSSFEQRIRERKAGRLREHIRASLDAGSPEAALQAVEELEAVQPGVPLPEDLLQRLRAHVPDAFAKHEERPGTPADPLPHATVLPASETPGYLREPSTSPAPSVVPPRPTASSALDLFPTATEWEPAVVETPAPLEELPLRERAPDARAAVAGRPRELLDHGPLRLHMAPASDARMERSAPFRERGAHVLGLLLLVSSILALSGWAGYYLFKPTTTVTDAPITDSDIPGPGADASQDTASQRASQPPVSDTSQAAASGDPETTGTAGGGSPTPDPGQLSAVPPATPPGVTPSTHAAAPASSSPAASAPPEREASSPPDREASTPSASRETATESESERTSPPSPPSSTPSSAGAQAAPAAQLPSVGGTTSQPPPVRASQPTPEPVPPLAQERSESPTAAVAPPASPAPARESGAEASAPASTAGDAAENATAEAGTSTRDAEAMRGLIEGYLAGYNNLDAGGVRGVWPSVDQRALARAFGQLRSQHLSFSRCEVRATGAAGHGFCTGHAAWRPRVGGGEKIEQRVWRFDFAQRNDDWIIQRVNVER